MHQWTPNDVIDGSLALFIITEPFLVRDATQRDFKTQCIKQGLGVSKASEQTKSRVRASGARGTISMENPSSAPTFDNSNLLQRSSLLMARAYGVVAYNDLNGAERLYVVRTTARKWRDCLALSG